MQFLPTLIEALAQNPLCIGLNVWVNRGFNNNRLVIVFDQQWQLLGYPVHRILLGRQGSFGGYSACCINGLGGLIR